MQKEEEAGFEIVDESNTDTIEVNNDNEKKDNIVEKETIELDDSNSVVIGDETSSAQEQGNSSSSALKNIAEALGNEGLINYDESKVKDFDSEAEYLRHTLNEEITKRELADLNDTQKDFLSKLRAGVDFRDYVNIKAKEQESNSYSESDIKDSETVQRKLYKEELILRGYSESDSNEMVEEAKSLNKLSEKAFKSKSFIDDHLVKEEKRIVEQNKLANQKAKESNEKAYNDAKKYVFDQTEIIPGIKINDSKKEDIFKKMTQPVGQDENGNNISYVQDLRSKNPLTFETKINYYASIGLFDENANFDEVIKSLKTKQSKSLDRLLSNNDAFVEGTGKQRKSESGDGLDDGFWNSISKM